MWKWWIMRPLYGCRINPAPLVNGYHWKACDEACWKRWISIQFSGAIYCMFITKQWILALMIPRLICCRSPAWILLQIRDLWFSLPCISMHHYNCRFSFSLLHIMHIKNMVNFQLAYACLCLSSGSCHLRLSKLLLSSVPWFWQICGLHSLTVHLRRGIFREISKLRQTLCAGMDFMTFIVYFTLCFTCICCMLWVCMAASSILVKTFWDFLENKKKKLII